jgi:hypothetical protein
MRLADADGLEWRARMCLSGEPFFITLVLNRFAEVTDDATQR